MRSRFRRVGVTVPKVAREMGVHPETVRRVLKGKLVGNRGDAHKVAVLLGLKDGVVTPEGTSAVEALRMAAKRDRAA